MHRLLLSVLLVTLLASVAAQEGQPFRLEVRAEGGNLIIGHPPTPAARFVLLAGPTPTSIQTVLATNRGTAGDTRFVVPLVGEAGRYLRVRRDLELEGLPLTTVESSPTPGEAGVAVTRETILRFSLPLAEDVQLDTTRFYATSAGRKLLARVELSSDRRTATLFYLENLPASSRVQVTLDATELRDFAGRLLDADGDGVAGEVLRLDFDTLTITPVFGTAIQGRVFASDPIPTPGGDGKTNFINRPLQGVTITVDGAEETIRTTTDVNGSFTLRNCPAGRFFVHIDGRTAVGSQWPNGAYYPFVGKAWEAAAGRDDNLAGGTGEVYLPLIHQDALQPVSATEDTVITFPAAVLAAKPALAGMSITVPANSLYADDGTRGGRVGIAPVPPDRLPGPLPGGLEFPLVITVQSDGPGNFDRPVPVCFPNLPDPGTGQPLKPGEKNWLYSFNHDTGEWEGIGPMTVSADGESICTDPGVGIRQPGWGGSGPPLSRKKPCRKVGCCPAPTRVKCTSTCSRECIAFVCVPVTWRLVGKRPNLLTGLIGGGIGALCIRECILETERCWMRCLKENCVFGGGSSGAALAQPDQEHQQAEEVNAALEHLMGAASLIEQFGGDELPALIRAEVESMYAAAVAALGSDPLDYSEERAKGSEQTYATELTSQSSLPEREVPFAAVTVLEAGGIMVLRSKTKADGSYELFLPRGGRLLFLQFFDAFDWSVGFARLREVREADDDFIGPFMAPIGPSAPDADADGLPDLAEVVLGTDPGNVDSDADSLPDGVEVRQGTNPLDGRPVATGVIASTGLPGDAQDVCAINNTAIVALGAPGVGVLNVFNGLNPTLIALVDTPGSAQAVACAGNLIAVADGAAGLALMDIAEPASARIVRQIGSSFLNFGSARAVAVAADLAFVGTDRGDVNVIELATGEVFQRVPLGGSVDGLAVEGLTLYAVANGQLHVLPFDTGALVRRGSVAAAGGRLFVGNARAYIAGGTGFRVYDVRDAAAPTSLAAVATGQLIWRQMVPNGSGYGLGAAAVNVVQPGEAQLWDLRGGTNTFVTLLQTPGDAKAISIFNGLAYVADGAAGLQVLNYLPYDAQKRPPTGALVISATNEVSAGGYVVVRAEVEDDVQVRNVEFFLNGELLSVDGNFPFEVVYRVPINRVGSRLVFSARVFDTGGNTTTITNVPSLTIVEDRLPPAVSIDSPASGHRLYLGDDLSVNVTATDNVGIGAVEFLLDGRPLTAATRPTSLQRLLLPQWRVAGLSRGRHTLVARARDLSGFVAESAPLDFEVWGGATSREFSVFNLGSAERPGASSREHSVFNFGADPKPGVVSREYSVFNLPSPERPGAISGRTAYCRQRKSFGRRALPESRGQSWSLRGLLPADSAP